ncbi:MAG: PIN domain-containing protein [Verrucomicrobiota bacterium]|nr:PIN domain-containing protein [Verrucomicrobiota bacterium]MDQ6939330.1 PIN domain-containing protein [Verrucomicrobiota bacterium]
MAREVLVDSSGLYLLADRRDPKRPVAKKCVESLIRAGVTLLLTDYIVGETCTLAKSRGGPHGAVELLDMLEASYAFTLVWIGEERFARAKTFFRKHADHGYSFTDCTSFVLMRELGILDAFTTDRHFKEAGFRPLLPLR